MWQTAPTILAAHDANGSDSASTTVVGQSSGTPVSRGSTTASRPGMRGYTRWPTGSRGGAAQAAPVASGPQAAVKAPPDGYTLYFGTNTLTINKVMMPSAAFDPLDDLVPIALLGETEFVLGVHPDVPVQTVGELIAYAKQNPDKLRYGATSYQGVFATEQFNALAGIRIERVPYRAMSDVQVDLLAGRIEMFLTTPASVAQFILKVGDLGKVVEFAQTAVDSQALLVILDKTRGKIEVDLGDEAAAGLGRLVFRSEGLALFRGGDGSPQQAVVVVETDCLDDAALFGAQNRSRPAQFEIAQRDLESCAQIVVLGERFQALA